MLEIPEKIERISSPGNEQTKSLLEVVLMVVAVVVNQHKTVKVIPQSMGMAEPSHVSSSYF
jgi:hypothetical protein